MIPTRPLALGDIISETSKMSWKTLKRVVMIALLLSAVSTFFIGWGVTDVLQRGYVTLEKNYPLDSASVSEFRVGVLRELREANPILLFLYFPDLVLEEELRVTSVSDTLQRDTIDTDSTITSIDTPPTVAISRNYLDEVGQFIDDNSEQFNGMFVTIMLSCLVTLFISIFLNTFIIDICVRDFEDRRMAIVAALTATLRRNVWVSLLMYLWMIFVFLFGFGVIIGISSFFPIFIEVLLLLSALAFLILAGIRLAFAQVALVSEELGPLDSLHRSWELTKGYFWPTLGTMVVLILLYIVVQTVSQEIIGLISVTNTDGITGLIYGNHTNISYAFENLNAIIIENFLHYLIITVLFVTCMPSLLTVMYYDLRTRKDGPLTYAEELPTETV